MMKALEAGQGLATNAEAKKKPGVYADFIAAHERVFVVEQNRDAQLRSLLINEFGIDPANLVPILHYDGTPITARFISGEISARVNAANFTSAANEAVASS